MKSLKSALSWLVKGSAVIAGSLGAISMAAPAMANQATASGAYTFTTPAGYVESYSGEVTLPDGYLFQGTNSTTVGDVGSVLQVEFVTTAAVAGPPAVPASSYLDLRTPVATAAANGVVPGSFNSAAATALTAAIGGAVDIDGDANVNPAVIAANGEVFGADQLDAIASIIKAGAGVDGLD